MAKLAENFNSRMDTIGEQLKEKNVKIPIDLTAGIVSFLIAAVIMVMMPSQVAVSESDIINGRAFPTLDVGYADLRQQYFNYLGNS